MPVGKISTPPRREIDSKREIIYSAHCQWGKYLLRHRGISTPCRESHFLALANFRQRAAQLLKSYGEVCAIQKYSFLRKLVRGMPRRLRRSREHGYGRCGKWFLVFPCAPLPSSWGAAALAIVPSRLLYSRGSFSCLPSRA